MPVSKIMPVTAIAALAVAIPTPLIAHSAEGAYEPVLSQPIAGRENNYWYDYRSDVDEAKNELRKDLRRAKKASDRREAWAEYNQELYDARKDYRQEMVELGYARRGEVIVEDD